MLDQLETLIREASLHTRMAIMFCSIVAGIALSQLGFALLRKAAARITDRSYPLVRSALKGMPTVWGILLGGFIAVQILTIPPRALIFLERIFNIIGIISLSVMGARLVSSFLTQKLQKTAGTFASTSILITLVELIVYITGFLFLLQSFGVSITPLLTALGVGGLAVALALQDTLSNLFSGINILLSKQIKMGDFIKLSTGEEGTVMDMNWRNTVIKQALDNMVVVPNLKIASSILTNYTLPYSECSIAIPVEISYDSDLEQVEKITLAVAKEVLREISGGLSSIEPFIRYLRFVQGSITFNVILRVESKTDQSLIQHEFIKRLHIRYRQESIKVPLPMGTVNFQQTNSSGEADKTID